MEYDDLLDGPLPHFASSLNNGNPMVIGAHLPTKDGRMIGNAVVVDIFLSEYQYKLVAAIITDAGNRATMNRSELEECFHPSNWIHNKRSIEDRFKVEKIFHVSEQVQP